MTQQNPDDRKEQEMCDEADEILRKIGQKVRMSAGLLLWLETIAKPKIPQPYLNDHITLWEASLRTT